TSPSTKCEAQDRRRPARFATRRCLPFPNLSSFGTKRGSLEPSQRETHQAATTLQIGPFYGFSGIFVEPCAALPAQFSGCDELSEQRTGGIPIVAEALLQHPHDRHAGV